MKIIGTGMTGLVGSRIAEILGDKYEFENASRSSGIDILDKSSLSEFFNSSNSSVVIHLAAKTDVDGCEEDKENDLKILKIESAEEQEGEFLKQKTAWGINVSGTKNIVEICKLTNKRIVFVSTDFVFDGEKNEPYVEEDKPNPINWYGRTKFEAERIIQSSNIPFAIIRISYPYRGNFQRKDFVRVLLEKLKEGEKLKMISDQIITPTFVDDLAKVFDRFISEDLGGIYHATGNDYYSPYDIAVKIAQVLDCDTSLISKITGAEFFKDRAKRPFHLALKNDKIKGLGIQMRGFEEGLSEIKKQI